MAWRGKYFCHIVMSAKYYPTFVKYLIINTGIKFFYFNLILLLNILFFSQQSIKLQFIGKNVFFYDNFILFYMRITCYNFEKIKLIIFYSMEEYFIENKEDVRV